ncbi:MAG: hypothetical protein KC800_26200 [Candidatus Eremiobacteraeota bacterium]|nr:hypothetical protein [Candidatus Eremiobacteraeota bacterium]
MLGCIFQELLPQLRVDGRSVRLAVTRPSGRSYGEGALRVIRVREDDSSVDLLLAYERYHPRKEPKKKRGRRNRGS